MWGRSSPIKRSIDWVTRYIYIYIYIFISTLLRRENTKKSAGKTPLIRNPRKTPGVRFKIMVRVCVMLTVRVSVRVLSRAVFRHGFFRGFCPKFSGIFSPIFSKNKQKPTRLFSGAFSGGFLRGRGRGAGWVLVFPNHLIYGYTRQLRCLDWTFDNGNFLGIIIYGIFNEVLLKN